jgi:bacterioferritin B
MPSERFVDALNAQISREFAAAHQYTAIGAWYTGETYPQLASFFFAQAEEEREHALKMVNYLLDTNSAVDFTGVDSPRTDFEDHIAPIRLALEQEQSVTVSISELFEVARETRDYRSEQFLDWFLEEQTEEESSMSDLLAVAERTASVPMLLEEYLAREQPGGHPAE